MNDPGYYNDNKLIRPYRVGVACGSCHIAPNPSNPPLARNDFHAGHRKCHKPFCVARKSFRSRQRRVAKKDFALRTERDHREGLQGWSWMDKKIASSSTIPRRSLLVHWVRDEIREVAPRTYLGKVYLGKKRLIDFALEFPAAT